MAKSQDLPSAYSTLNRVKLIRGGRDYFDLMLKLIHEARHTIHLQVYIFDEDETGKEIAEALQAAARRDIKIFLLVDGFGSKNLSSVLIKKLETTGIQFRFFHPFFRGENFYFGRRLHHKVMVVDAHRTLVAGLNISNRYNDTHEGKAWLDWAVFAEGEVAHTLGRICIRRFKRRMRILPDEVGHQHMQLEGMHANSSIRVLVNDWVNRKREISRNYIDMFRTAKSHITLMSPYFLPGHEFKKHLKAALQRGVTVKVIQAGISDVPVSKNAERYMYDWLLQHGVEIYEYKKNVLHGKVGVCDSEWATVGSYNLNNLSAYVSVELNLDVRNAPFAEELQTALDQIMKHDCRKITERIHKKNSTIWARIVQKGSYDLSRSMLYLFSFYYRQRE